MSDNQTCDWLPRKCKMAEEPNSTYRVTLTEGLEPAHWAKPVISEVINHKKKPRIYFLFLVTPNLLLQFNYRQIKLLWKQTGEQLLLLNLLYSPVIHQLSSSLAIEQGEHPPHLEITLGRPVNRNTNYTLHLEFFFFSIEMILVFVELINGEVNFQHLEIQTAD